MTEADPVFLPALEQARLIRERQLSPVELVDAYLDRIDAYDEHLGSYLTVDRDGARAQAKVAERAVVDGSSLPPFHGVTVSIKDLNNTAGLRTSWGLAALRDNVPDTDDFSVAQLRRAGFIIIGKTNTPALGLGCVTEPDGFPPARNPWDPDRTPGGSSGGAAAALAAGLCAASQGSDGGGSIRIPSSWCGVVGLKPSRGRISSAPHPSSFNATSGPIARTVADAAAILDVMAGNTSGDAFFPPPFERSLLDQIAVEPPPLRVAVSFGGRAVEPAIGATIEQVSKLLSDLGHDVIERDPEPAWGTMIEQHIDAMMAVGMRGTADQIAGADAQLDPLVQKMIDASVGLPAEAFAAAMSTLQNRARTAASAFSEFDILLSPTVAKAPPRVGEHRELSAPDLFIKWESYVPFTTMWNWTGQPAISVPAAVDDHDLPVGVQLVGQPVGEAMLLRLAAQLEAALGPTRMWRRPAIRSHVT